MLEILKGTYRFIKGKIQSKINEVKYKNSQEYKNYNRKIAICKSCEFYDVKGDRCFIPGTAPCCAICGCSIELKAHSDDECPIGKW